MHQDDVTTVLCDHAIYVVLLIINHVLGYSDLESRFDGEPGFSASSSSSNLYSNKFVIQKTFGGIKNLTFGYNMNIIRE
jgi:hypothetical protein